MAQTGSTHETVSYHCCAFKTQTTPPFNLKRKICHPQCEFVFVHEGLNGAAVERMYVMRSQIICWHVNMAEIGPGWEQLGHPQTQRSSKKISFYCSSPFSAHFIAPPWKFTCFKSVLITTIKTQLGWARGRMSLSLSHKLVDPFRLLSHCWRQRRCCTLSSLRCFPMTISTAQAHTLTRCSNEHTPTTADRRGSVLQHCIASFW